MSERKTVLYVEPDSMLRRTVSSTARSLFHVEVMDSSRYENALPLVQNTRFDGLLLSLGEEDGLALDLVGRLRRGEFKSHFGIPVVFMCYGLNEARSSALHEAGARRIVMKPVKVRNILEAFGELAALNAPQHWRA